MFGISRKKSGKPGIQIPCEPEIEVVTDWEKADGTYFAPGVLVAVRNGKGILREVMAEPAARSTRR